MVIDCLYSTGRQVYCLLMSVLLWVLQFLKAVDGLATVPGEVQTARLQLVRGMDGGLEAHTASGACVELSWRFAHPQV